MNLLFSVTSDVQEISESTGNCLQSSPANHIGTLLVIHKHYCIEQKFQPRALTLNLNWLLNIPAVHCGLLYVWHLSQSIFFVSDIILCLCRIFHVYFSPLFIIVWLLYKYTKLFLGFYNFLIANLRRKCPR